MSGALRWPGWFVLMLGLLLTTHPGHAQEAAPAANAPKGDAAITDEEALAFGEDLVDAMLRDDRKAVTAAIDMEAIIDAAQRGIPTPDAMRKEFRDGFLESLKEQGGPLLREYRPRLQAGATLRAIRALQHEGHPTVLVRMVEPEGAAHYVLFYLDRQPDGSLRAHDYYTIAAGELATEIIRRLYLSVVAQANRGVLGRLFGAERSLGAHMMDLERMAIAKREGRPEETLAIFDKLPQEVQREKAVLLIRYAAAQAIGDDKLYVAAIEDLAREFPGDVSTDFLLIDGYLLQNQPEKSLQCLDRVAKSLGGDAYLTFLRGNLFIVMEKHDEARQAFRDALAVEPDLFAAYDSWLTVELKDKRYAEVARLLDAAAKILGQPIEGLEDNGEFKGFFESLEGKAWRERQRGSKNDEAPAP